MSIDTTAEPRQVRVRIAMDGSRKMIDTGSESGPRPLDDEALEAVSGGGSFRVTFQDGCSSSITVINNL